MLMNPLPDKRNTPHTADLGAQHLGRAAVRALYAEIALEPKPGLVSFRDCGSHQDMNGATFVRSLFALRSYFPQMAQAGQNRLPFSRLESMGKNAEARMMAASRGINTHRGAIFGLGLLCASAGQLQAQGLPFNPLNLQAVLLSTWGEALTARAKATRTAQPGSNGQHVAQRFGMRSAGEEAAQAFPTLFDITLPALQAAQAAGANDRAARVQALFACMVELDDTNVVHRGGLEGLRFVQAQAQSFLTAGGVFQTNWLLHARAIHAAFVQRRLSPGGSADVLASACWVHEISRLTPPATTGLSAPARAETGWAQQARMLAT